MRVTYRVETGAELVRTGLGSFVNRSSELDSLRAWFERPGPGLGVVFGRKRVGKSWLLARFAENRRAIQHTARGRPLAEELRLLSVAAEPAIKLARRSLTGRPFIDWDDAFSVLADAAAEQPLLVVLDEFPELLKLDPRLEEELRAVWDRVGAGETHLKLLVCGSSVRVMEALGEQHGAMFGRADLRLHVAPFRPHEAALMLAAATPAERAAAWGVCGGIPRYLALWDASASFTENLARLVCNEQGLLLSEGELVLADEDIVGHRGERLPELVLRAVAAGATSYSAISSAIGRLPIRTLKDLTDVRLLDKVFPVTDDPTRSKHTYYRIADNFLAFWLACIEPHRAQIERGLGSAVAPVIAAAFNDHMRARYESAFRDHVRRLAAEGHLASNVVAVGEWWRSQSGGTDDPCQLDMVALAGRKKVPVAVGEAKWARNVNGSSIRGAIRRKLFDSGLADPDTVSIYVCGRDNVDRPAGVEVVTAADIFTAG